MLAALGVLIALDERGVAVGSPGIFVGRGFSHDIN
jgi:hypothetical protein